ncbi:MAG TPA: class I SAM-dependent methyltransferase [Woeseiaceae bacterium]
MVSSRNDHWDRVYSGKGHQSVSWFQESPDLSLAMIRRAASPPASVIDVGGGASHLADRLLDAGYRVGVLDISEEPLRIVQARLGARQAEVEWIATDVCTFRSAKAWDVWHDRAVFHFLVTTQDRAAYIEAVSAATRQGSAIVIATFGPQGPDRCSGLPIARYSPEQLAEEFGSSYELEEAQWENHQTPSGATQQFVYCRFRRTG